LQATSECSLPNVSLVGMIGVASEELYTDSDNLSPNSTINSSYPPQETGSEWFGSDHLIFFQYGI
jgi:hypothetical protein